MTIPIITECIIEKATKCYKYLLITGTEDPTITMQEQNPKRFYNSITYQVIEIMLDWETDARNCKTGR